MIYKAENLNFDDKKICMIIAGVAGIGKTTLALSSPAPLLIDLDNGVDRVEARYRTDTDVVSSFEELESDLKNSDLSKYQTIVIDTGGKLLEMLKPVVISEDTKNGKRDGNLSIAGYGAVKKKFKQFIKFVKDLKKHLVIIFHATEVNLQDDLTGLRIRIEGSSKDEIWDDVDLGGFIEMRGNKRTIGFSNCDRYYAKGTHGISGIFEIPTLKTNDKNDCLSNLFSSYLKGLKKDQDDLKAYKEVMSKYLEKINNMESKEDYEKIIQELKEEKNFPLTSKNEIAYHLKVKNETITNNTLTTK